MSSSSSSLPDSIPLPAPFSSIPRHPLTLTSSPIHPLPRITAALHTEYPPTSSTTTTTTIYAKRDDLTSPYAFGGNKTRKLEYLVAEALSQGATTLVSIGGVQSNHTRQVAAVAAALGLKARLVQEKWVDWADQGYDVVGNIQLSRLMGADVRVVQPTQSQSQSQAQPQQVDENEKGGIKGDDGVTFSITHKPTLQSLFNECLSRGEKPYYIPAGASDHPLGGLGFARWAFEVHEQEARMGVRFDSVIVCAVTGSTMGGMVAGFKLLARENPDQPAKKVIGIDASAKPAETRAQVLRIAQETGRKIGLAEGDITEADVVLKEEYHAGCYGVPDKATWEAIGYAARMEAFITDPVYEGKSFAGMMDLVRRGEVSGNVLYAHLGGQMALSAYSEIGATK